MPSASNPLTCAFILWTFIAQALVSPAEAEGAYRPNIIFLLIDDQCFYAMGSMNPLVHTPNMDRLADEGVRFENAFVTISICTASRASILIIADDMAWSNYGFMGHEPFRHLTSTNLRVKTQSSHADTCRPSPASPILPRYFIDPHFRFMIS